MDENTSMQETVFDDNSLSPNKYKKKRFRKKKKSAEKTMSEAVKPNKKTVLTNICYKNSSGLTNWQKFLEIEGKMDSIKVGSGQMYDKKVMVPLLKNNSAKRTLSVSDSGKTPEMTKVVAMDCEMVGIGENGIVSQLARVSIVNYHGECIYDKYVKPVEPVTDYRTFVSGIRPHDIVNGEDFFVVQKEVAKILKGRVIVGHALKNDFAALITSHPRKYIRDTMTCSKFRKEVKGPLSLKNLTLQFLNVEIQDGEHNSVEDARAAMQLYSTYRKEWEKSRQDFIRERRNKIKNDKIKTNVETPIM